MKLANSKTRIGISLRVVSAKDYDEKRDALSQEWVPFLEKLDAFPIFIPNTLANVKSFLKEMGINGLILSGGDNPGENYTRDSTEKKIIEFGISSMIPIFGVCRGMQILNQHFGGSIVTHSTFNHTGKPHLVQITNVKFSKYLHTDSLKVNSFHNNTITNEGLGKNLHPFATFSEDQTVEGFFHKEYPILGVMWHPERDPNSSNQSILKKLFQSKVFWAK